jgi:hypothetical protein
VFVVEIEGGEDRSVPDRNAHRRKNNGTYNWGQRPIIIARRKQEHLPQSHRRRCLSTDSTVSLNEDSAHLLLAGRDL